MNATCRAHELAWVNWPSDGDRELNTAQERIEMTASSNMGRHPWATWTNATTRNGTSATTWDTTRAALSVLLREPSLDVVRTRPPG